jgi:hypothetical protein
VRTNTGQWYGGGVAPPAFPAIVRPIAADGSKHVAAHDPRPDIFEAPQDKRIVEAGGAALLPKHLSEGAGGKGPFVERKSANAERIFEALIGAGAIAVER